MNDAATPPEAGPLAALRAEIDGVDQALLDLIAQRLRLGDRVAQAKADSTGLPIRPGREVMMLRKLIASAPAPLDADLTVEIWRSLIAANLRRQRMIDVVVGGGRGDPTRLFDIARRHFGSRMRITHVGEAQQALLKATENPDNVVAITTWPAAPGVGAWWPALTEQRFRGLQLIAALPVRGDEEPEAALFAVNGTEPAGGDVTLLIAFDPHHRVVRALNEVGLKGKEIARAEPRVLLKVEGYIADDDPRAAAMLGHGLDGVRVLGSYARV